MESFFFRRRTVLIVSPHTRSTLFFWIRLRSIRKYSDPWDFKYLLHAVRFRMFIFYYSTISFHPLVYDKRIFFFVFLFLSPRIGLSKVKSCWREQKKYRRNRRGSRLKPLKLLRNSDYPYVPPLCSFVYFFSARLWFIHCFSVWEWCLPRIYRIRLNVRFIYVKYDNNVSSVHLIITSWKLGTDSSWTTFNMQTSWIKTNNNDGNYTAGCASDG